MIDVFISVFFIENFYSVLERSQSMVKWKMETYAKI